MYDIEIDFVMLEIAKVNMKNLEQSFSRGLTFGKYEECYFNFYLILICWFVRKKSCFSVHC